MAVVLALLAAGANALATVFQRLGVEDANTTVTHVRRSLMAALLRRPIWFAGLGLTVASFLLQAIALAVGNLSTVQPVMVTELLFLALILGGWFKQTFGRREWLGVAGIVFGLGSFLALSAARGGQQRPDGDDWLILLTTSGAALIAVLAASTRRGRSWRAALLGTAGAICFALTAAFIKTAADLWSHDPVSSFQHWQTYAVALAGLGGFVITQHALDAGPVAASQSALLILNPLASIVMGVWLFGDRLRTGGGRGLGEVLALAVMFLSLFALSHSPLIESGEGDERLSTGRPPTRVHAEGVTS